MIRVRTNCPKAMVSTGCRGAYIGQAVDLRGLEHGSPDKKSRFGRFFQKDVNGASEVFLVQRFGNCFLPVHQDIPSLLRNTRRHMVRESV